MRTLILLTGLGLLWAGGAGRAAAPDRESNGLAQCVLHHKLFDLGAFSLNSQGILLVSEEAHGSAGFQEALLRHHGSPMRPPQRPEWQPEPRIR